MDYALMGDEGTLAVLSLCVGQETTPRMLVSAVLRAESSVDLAAKRRQTHECQSFSVETSPVHSGGSFRCG